MPKITRTILYQSYLVLIDRNIPFTHKIYFLIPYLISTVSNIISHPYEKEVTFLDRGKFKFLGNHFNLLLDHLSSHLVHYLPYYRDAKVIIDVGASFGSFSKIVSYFNPTAKIFSIEMTGLSFEILKKNCRNAKGISTFQNAVGDKNEKVSYSVDPNLPEGGNLSKITYSSKGEVEQITLDKFIEKNRIRSISLLKIDTEGYELKVLRGASNTLKITQCIIIEVDFNMSNFVKVVQLMNLFRFDLVGFGTMNIRTNSTVDSGDLIFIRR